MMTWIKRALVIGLLHLLVLGVLLPLGAVDEAAPGYALYQQYCSSCHGERLQGGNAQSLIDGVWQFGEGRDYIHMNIKYGLPNLGMPAYDKALSDAHIRQITNFLLASESSAGVSKPPIPEQTETLHYVIRIEKWVDGLEVPWSLCFLDADTALVTERPGRLRLVKNGILQPAPIADTPAVLNEGQGGLLDVAIDPDYAANGWIYLAYSHALPAEGGQRPTAMTRIVRGRLKNNAWTEQQVIFEAPHETYLTTRLHYGCRIVFDKKGYLYFGIGERGIMEHAQELHRPNGKIHRIRPDGTVPKDNPFFSTEKAIPTIFSYGNRNPQGLAIHPVTDALWEVEHGPLGGDEVNLIQAGKNYGWPVITYGRNYDGTSISDMNEKAGMEQPILYYLPSIAICSMDFYTGDLFGRWKNRLLVTALKYEEVRLLDVKDDRVLHDEVILKNAGRVRDVVCGPDGAIYAILNDPGTILRLTPKK